MCSSLPQHTATHINTLQHTATHCNTLQHTATQSQLSSQLTFENNLVATSLERIATHCNIVARKLCMTNPSCSELIYILQHCNTLKRTAPLYDTLQHSRAETALDEAESHCFYSRPQTLQHTATLCSTLQHVATRCNTFESH